MAWIPFCRLSQFTTEPHCRSCFHTLYFANNVKLTHLNQAGKWHPCLYHLVRPPPEQHHTPQSHTESVCSRGLPFFFFLKQCQMTASNGERLLRIWAFIKMLQSIAALAQICTFLGATAFGKGYFCPPSWGLLSLIYLFIYDNIWSMQNDWSPYWKLQ